MEQMNPKKNYGFVKPKVTKEDYQMKDGRLGVRFGAKVLQPDGQWNNFLPIFELQQKNGFETMSCWCFGTLNCLETLYKRLYNDERNYAERYIVVLGNGTTNGGSPHNAAEAIRKFGVIPEEELPFSDNINTWGEWKSPKPMTTKFLQIGANWLKEYTYGHDWVAIQSKWGWFKRIFGVTNQEILKDALQYSPLGVSVCAWKFRNGLAYKNTWDSDNHWLMLYGYEDGKYWKLYDHYTNMYIKAEWQYPFGFIKRYTLNKIKSDSMRTIKKKDEPDIYVVNSINNKELTVIKGWESYQDMINFGWLIPFEEVDSLDGYTKSGLTIGLMK